MLQAWTCVWYTPFMRNWMRERMKRRKKKQENTAEATGKVGQQKPPVDAHHPEPIVPTYDDVASDAQNPVAEPLPASSAHDRRMETEVQPDTPSVPPPGAPEQQRPVMAGKTTRAPKGVVVLAIGLPGSGKTTWFKRRGVTPLSSDLLRSILFDDITEQRYQGLVFSTLRSLLRARLIARMPWNYVDASNLSAHERRQWIKMAKGFGYEVHAVFFDVPVEVCLERNRKRERQVKEDVVQRMAAKLKAPSFEEGFAKITVVRVKQQIG
jgi:predicted kinase